MEFNDLEFLQNLSKYIQDNISDLKKAYIYQFPQKPTFPIAIVSIDQTTFREQDLDSQRNYKYYYIVFSIDVFVKSSSEEEDKFVSCMQLKNTILQLLQSSNVYKNIILQLDKPMPNLNSDVCRWKLTFNCLVDVNNNYIL